MHQKHEYSFRVPFADVDHAGIVYYPRLFHYFHLAYEDFFHSALGFPFQEFFSGDESLAAPITRAEARFSAPLRHGDQVTALAWIGALEGTNWEWCFELHARGQSCATGRVRHAFVQLPAMHRVALPEDLRERVLPWLEAEDKT